MADVHSKEARSYNMSRIRSKDTKPEEIFRKYLFSHGLRYRKNDKRLPGTPDIVIKKYNTVIFIHGCFWHMHEGCKYFKYPSTNAEWWKMKLHKNKERDEKKIKELQSKGWNVIIIWECEIKSNSIFIDDKILNEIRKSR
ncbi:MAG: DNA mismatch endonuclease Vsr [Clostridiaceae bacterium]|nr:DNA mismatch endonuclease Vsr [Clostridiaceae bacterium]